jgi:Raf kinase inhibitor-like YbhB/YbcL family protein
MLEKLPSAIGKTLRRMRAGFNHTVSSRPELAAVPQTIVVESPAFTDGTAMPERFTADGEGRSPPLRWANLPRGTRSIALIVEDVDSPTPIPLVHAITAHLPALLTELEEGALNEHAGGPLLGKNSFLRAGWLPPDPPPGHGPHHYVFQVFALDHDPELGPSFGRTALAKLLAEHTLARGALVGTYTRD